VTNDPTIVRVEKGLLGALILTNTMTMCARLTPDMFSSPKRAAIFRMMQLHDKAGKGFDAVTLAADLEPGPEPPPKIGWLPLLASYLDDCCAGLEREYANIILRNHAETSARTVLETIRSARGTGR
jgi:replicative DNA helicase